MVYRSQLGPVASPRADAEAATRPVTSAEAAQARLFENILRAEIADLLSLSSAARGEQSSIQELDRLLKALRERFPHGPRVEPGLRLPAQGARRGSLN